MYIYICILFFVLKKQKCNTTLLRRRVLSSVLKIYNNMTTVPIAARMDLMFSQLNDLCAVQLKCQKQTTAYDFKCTNLLLADKQLDET